MSEQGTFEQRIRDVERSYNELEALLQKLGTESDIEMQPSGIQERIKKLNAVVNDLRADMKVLESKEDTGGNDPDGQALLKELDEFTSKLQLLEKTAESKLQDSNSRKQSRSSNDQALLSAAQGGNDRAPYYETISDANSPEQAVLGTDIEEVQEDNEMTNVMEVKTAQADQEISKTSSDEIRKSKRLRWIVGITAVFISALIIASIFDS